MKLFSQLLQLIALRRKASDISYLPESAIICFVIYALTSYFQLAGSPTEFPVNHAGFAVAQAVLQALMYYLILSINRKQNRFIQMATAIFGSLAIMQFASLILMNLGFVAILSVALSGWSFALIVIILKDTLECSLIAAILLTIAYHFLVGLCLFMLFPDFYSFVQSQVPQAAA